MRSITIKVPAKINLHLKVLRPPRDDGFHEVRSIMQAVALADVVELALTDEAGIGLTCTDPTVPTDESNLAVRAAIQFYQVVDAPSLGVGIHIRKGIPLEAGLGGGSADAAATLFGLRALLAPNVPNGHLESMAADLGSDVPFFIAGGTQVALGRGDMLAPATHPLGDTALVIAKPQAGCSTREVYSRYDAGVGTGEDAPPLAEALSALADRRLDEVVGNDLRPAAVAVTPDVSRVLSTMADCGLGPVEVTGSGSACFGIAESEGKAIEAARALRETFPFAQACMTWSGGCEVLRE